MSDIISDHDLAMQQKKKVTDKMDTKKGVLERGFLNKDKRKQAEKRRGSLQPEEKKG